VGIGGIVYQMVTGQYNLTFLAVFTAMVGAPGLTNAVSQVRRGGGQIIELPPSMFRSSDSRSDSTELQKSSDGDK